MRIRAVTAVYCLTLFACTSGEVDAPVGVARAPLVDVWASPTSTVPKGSAPQRPVFDGTQFWVTHSVRTGDPFDTRDVLRRYDAQGNLADTGPVRIGVRGGKLVRINGSLVSLSISKTPDGGAALFTQPINAQGLTGARVLTQELMPGSDLNGPEYWYVASSATDSRVLIRNFPAGTQTVTELAVAADGTTSAATTVWPTTTTTLFDMHFDGTRYLALVGEADGGVALMGLSGPGNETRFYRPVVAEPGFSGALGGDATLGGVITANHVQLTVDAQLVTAPIVFSRPAVSYRDGDHLVVVSSDVGFSTPLAAYPVFIDGGIGAKVVLDPPYTGPIYYFTESAIVAPVALSPTTALVGWTRQQGGTGAFVNALTLGALADNTTAPMYPSPALFAASGPIDTFDSPPLVVWAQESVYDDQCTFGFERIGPTGGLDATPIRLADCQNSFGTFAIGPIAASGMSGGWLTVWSTPFDIYSKTISLSGVPGPTRVISASITILQPTSIAAGGGSYLVTASKLYSSTIGYLVNPDGTAQSSEFTISGVGGNTTATAYDGTRFHVVTSGLSVTQWAIVQGGTPQLRSALSTSPSGLASLASGTGHASAAWTDGARGALTVNVAQLGASPSPVRLGSWDAGDVSSLSVAETDFGTHVAAGSPNGLQWFDLWPDGGSRLTLLFAGSAVASAKLQHADGGIVMVRSMTLPASQVHVDWVRFQPTGASCVDDLDCFDFRCFAGVCCPTCVAPPDAGAPDAGSPDAGTAVVDSGLSTDAGLDADAGALVDAGAFDAGAASDGGSVMTADAGAGVQGIRVLAVGCSCASVSSSSGFWLALLLLGAWRRALRSQAQ